MEHNYENCHNLSCKRKSEKFGMLLAYQSVKEEMDSQNQKDFLYWKDSLQIIFVS